MGWLGPLVGDVQHEGWVVPIFADGAEGAGTTSSHAVLVARRDEEAEQWRPAEAVVGWVPRCECGWRGRPWTRTHSTPSDGPSTDDTLIDAAHRLIYQPGPYADLDGEAEGLVMEEWRRHVARWIALERVEAAAGAQTAATRELDEAVHEAKAAGASWADIGRATGMTRQSANERWSRLTSQPHEQTLP
jgi:hypothetical protein